MILFFICVSVIDDVKVIDERQEIMYPETRKMTKRFINYSSSQCLWSNSSVITAK